MVVHTRGATRRRLRYHDVYSQDMCHAAHVMDHAPCARQHSTQITTCDQTEGRNLSTHLDLCVSSVTQKISQNRLRIVTVLQKKNTFPKYFRKS